jgi:hypothetical protein
MPLRPQFLENPFVEGASDSSQVGSGYHCRIRAALR